LQQHCQLLSTWHQGGSRSKQFIPECYMDVWST